MVDLVSVVLQDSGYERSKYSLFYIVKNKLFQLGEKDCPLRIIDENIDAEEELILKDVNDQGTAEKSRQNEVKRMQKVAGFFGVQKSEAQVIQIRNALSQAKKPSESEGEMKSSNSAEFNVIEI